MEIKKKAIVYVRSATKACCSQKFWDQYRALSEYAERVGLEVDGMYFHDAELIKERRDLLQQAVQTARRLNIPFIIAESFDRVTRNKEDVVVLNEWLQESEDRELHLVKNRVVINKNSNAENQYLWNICVAIASPHNQQLISQY